MSVDHLLHSDGALQREYAKQAAADGVITYSYSTDSFKWIEPESSVRWTSAKVANRVLAADAQQSKWIDSIFGFIDSMTGVSFQKVQNQRGEIHLSFVEGDFSKPQTPESETVGAKAFLNGFGRLYSSHDKMQYGALVDIRAIQTTILEAIGVTAPNGNSSDANYSWDNTLMSGNGGGLKSFGATFFLTQDDQEVVRSILGPSSSTPTASGEKMHKSTGRETLMIGSDGVKDTFQLTTKGMLLDRGRDEKGWINYYNSSYVANLNPADGDRILIHRSLLDPKTPVSSPSRKLASTYRKTRLRFKQIFGDTYVTGENVYYNDAGKILMDTNGKEPGLTPKGSPSKAYLYEYNTAGINGQIAAFVDPVGPETVPFQGAWLDFFM